MKKVPVVLLIALSLPVFVKSQNIPIRTVPLASGDQFLLFPSQNLGMGGVSVAVDDPLADPFSNPAKGIRVEGITFVATPAYYGISRNNGGSGSSAHTLPLSFLFRSNNLFGALTWARQSLTPDAIGGGGISPAFFNSAVGSVGDDNSKRNNYTFGMAGTKISGLNLSVGVSVFWADLNAMDGVQYLYPNTRGLEQSGYVADYRIGLLGELPNERSYEAVLSHHETNMEHRVTSWRWEGPILYDARPGATQYYQQETHLDQTSGNGIKLGYQQPLTDQWRIGGLIAANWKSHPKIPNYELMNIPRDPGNSIAYNIGLGLSTQGKKAVFGFDVIYEPIVSDTWADAAAPVISRSGRVIPIGEKTVANSFDFYNHIARIGFRTFGPKAEFNLGVNLHHIKYYMKQINHVEEFVRTQKEEWTEFTFSIAFGVQVAGAKIKYTGLFTTGTGRPGVAGTTMVTSSDWARAENFIIAPSGRLVLDEAFIATHQVSIMVQIE